MRRKNIKSIIQEYFFINPLAKVRVRQLERILNVPLPSVIRYCRELEEENLIIKEKVSNVVFYKANRNSKDFIRNKRIYNLEAVLNSGIIEYLKEKIMPKCIVLLSLIHI